MQDGYVQIGYPFEEILGSIVSLLELMIAALK
jgi:hypothetical protein